jgi:ABC-type phosphate transport system auxiliary subunit
VEAIEGVRNAANARMAKLGEKDPLRQQLQKLAADCDALRSKIVATKEGGMITGEERIRELLGQLYGAVAGYDGKPTDYQVARTESLGHELQDVIDDFQKLTQKDLAGINAGLKKKKLESITVLAEGDWQKKQAESSVAAGAGMRQGEEEEDRRRDRD